MTKAPQALRRRLIGAGLAAPVAALALPRAGDAEQAPLTPACVDGQEATPRQTAGPFFKPNSPERASLIEPGMSGQRLRVAGRVLDRACRPLPSALIEVWHAGPDGRYDNRGYLFRGHLFADADGSYVFETLTPGLYRGRTRHLHLTVQAAGGRPLTTQLYFPGEAFNARDGLFRPDLLMAMAQDGPDLTGRFDFVLGGA